MVRKCFLLLVLFSIQAFSQNEASATVNCPVAFARVAKSTALFPLKATKFLAVKGWDLYISPVTASVEVAKRFKNVFHEGTLSLFEVNLAKKGAKALTALMVFGVLPNGCAVSMSFLDEFANTLPADPNANIVIVDGFDMRPKNKSEDKDLPFWHPIAAVYHEQRAERLRKKYKHVSVIYPNNEQELHQNFKDIAQRLGKISYVEFYGHGAPGYITLGPGLMYYSNSEKFPWSFYNSIDVLKESGIGAAFSPDANISFRECDIGLKNDRFLETIKAGYGVKSVSGSQVLTTVSPLREPIEFFTNKDLPAALGLASDYLSGPLRLASCFQQYFANGTKPFLVPVRTVK